MTFDLRRIRFYEWMLALFGAGLIGVLFVHWYRIPGRRFDGWQAFGVTDVVLAGLGAVAISVAVAAATHRTAALPQALAAVAALAGIIATVLVLVRAASVPHLATAATAGPVTREAGLWLALACAIGIAVCGWRSMADEHFPEPMRPQLNVERLELPS
jgi:hypothetical protein